MYNLVTFVPETHLESLKSALFSAGAGSVGNYDSCTWCIKGIGQFRPKEGAKPFLGSIDEVEKVEEWRIEMVVEDEKVEAVVKALLEAHPYETPAYHLYPIISSLEELQNGKKC